MIATTQDKPTKPEASQFKKSKAVIRRWCNDRFKVGAELMRIRDERLYRGEFGSFEAFCQKEYNWTRDNAYKLIDAAKVRLSLPKSVEKIIQNPAQSRAIAEVKEESREAVIEEAAKHGPVTAASITEAAKKVEGGNGNGAHASPSPEPKAEPKLHHDETGHAIPSAILDDWHRAEAFDEVIGLLRKVRKTVKHGLGDPLAKPPVEHDAIFAEVGNSTLAALRNSQTDLERVLPYAICPTCQGRTRAKCSLCKQRGWISKFMWDTCIPSETRAIRLKATAKR